MAVEDKYVQVALQNAKKGNAAQMFGAPKFGFAGTFELAAADADGSIYRIAKALPADLIITKINIWRDQITNGTNFEIGFYETLERGGAEIDKDVLLGTTDFSGAATAITAPINGLGAVVIANIGSTIAELCGHTLSTRKLGYDLAITGNVVGTVAGTISYEVEFLG